MFWVFSLGPPLALEAQSLVQFHTLQKNLPVKLAAETHVCCNFSEKCLLGHAQPLMKERHEIHQQPGVAVPGVLMLGEEEGQSQEHTQYIFSPDGASDLLEFNF